MATRDRVREHPGDAGPLRRPLVRRLRERWGRERVRLAVWRTAYLLVLAGLVLASVLDQPYRAAISAWVVAGSVAWISGVVAERDRARQIRLHDTSGLPAIGGWRLVAPPGELAPEDLLALDLVAWLYDHAHLEQRPIRGHPRGGTRATYAGGGLRALARRWAAERGAPVRLGDRTLARLRALGVVHGVRISQVVAHRMTYATAEDALRALERSTGHSLIAWELGRDPRGDHGADEAPSRTHDPAPRVGTLRHGGRRDG
jgi:hypothetical protein